MEVIPLVLIGLEAYQTSRMRAVTPWMQRYRWPITFFVGVGSFAWFMAGLLFGWSYETRPVSETAADGATVVA
jgi:nitric oxide reductase subunit B